MSDSTDLPRFPQDVSPGPAGAATPRPGTINGAFWAFLAATVISIVSGLLVLTQRDTLADALRKSDTGLTAQQVDQATTVALVAAVVIAVIIALLYLLFAVKLRAGRNWARIVLTVLTALQVLSLLAGSGGSWIGYLSCLAAVIGVVLSFLPESSAYITAARTVRR
ncbi:hypothetical protein OG943_15260 [Amycolatopsis sp. NBC_00345]|uniref:hypothetical protein n=1 Tax=Amycolatopsis sp. NBC_00345 TaxID=2975955 RepID=UPI002E26C6DB